MTSKFVVIKETRYTETEQTKYGPYTFSVVKEFKSNGKDIIETTYKNGIIWYSAMYPAGTEYAQKRIA